MANMKMISPVTGDLRCTTYNAVEAQLKMGANNIFVQLKAYDIQVCPQRPLHIWICANIIPRVHNISRLIL